MNLNELDTELTQWVTLGEACKLIGCSRATLHRWMRNGTFLSILRTRVGGTGKRRFHRDSCLKVKAAWEIGTEAENETEQ